MVLIGSCKQQSPVARRLDSTSVHELAHLGLAYIQQQESRTVRRKAVKSQLRGDLLLTDGSVRSGAWLRLLRLGERVERASFEMHYVLDEEVALVTCRTANTALRI